MDFVTDPPLMKGRILTSGVYTVEPIKKEDLPEEPVPEKVYKAYLKGGSLPEACGLTRQDVVELVRNYDGEWCKHYCKIELQVKVPIVGGLIERSIAKDLQAAYDDSSLQTMEFLEFLKRGGSLEEQRREAVECERQIREEMGLGRSGEDGEKEAGASSTHRLFDEYNEEEKKEGEGGEEEVDLTDSERKQLDKLALED
uniref:Uncharacterized protein n=1 Tax=Palpitomonas bilix TaxID=652834 RepID=A0A7S3GDQ8_9EUKA|mmetsp:Transcript_45069/g.116542  ORF Transcript_45069/g.116542 Transcript_45069/m.116542 type:complete len:199 (+) Transcript_45069:445-1041(+)